MRGRGSVTAFDHGREMAYPLEYPTYEPDRRGRTSRAGNVRNSPSDVPRLPAAPRRTCRYYLAVPPRDCEICSVLSVGGKLQGSSLSDYMRVAACRPGDRQSTTPVSGGRLNLNKSLAMHPFMTRVCSVQVTVPASVLRVGVVLPQQRDSRRGA